MRLIYFLISTIFMFTSDYSSLIINTDNLKNKHHYNKVEIINYQNKQSTIPISFPLQNNTYLAQKEEKNPREVSTSEQNMVIVIFSLVIFLVFSSGVIALGGILQIFKVKDGYLRPLFIAFLINSAPIVFTLFKPEILFPSRQDSTIQNLQKEKQEQIKKIEKLENDGKKKDQEIIRRKEEIAALKKTLGNVDFFIKVASVNNFASQLEGGTFQLNHKKEDEERKEFCETIQELLKEIGQLGRKQNPNNDCIITEDKLKTYQDQKDISYGDLNYVYDPGRITNYLIKDYLKSRGFVD